MDDDRDATAAGKIRKRRFSSARIQPTRIKKVMQSDEEIGRMIASVPVAIGAAMEHFAEKVLESAAQCVQYSSARTLTPTHIRYAVLNNPYFSFLEELTKDIPAPRIEKNEQAALHAPTGSPAQPGGQLPAPLDCKRSSPSALVSTNYDLNANTASIPRPEQIATTVAKSHKRATAPRPSPSTSEASGEQVKRKRGRPRKNPAKVKEENEQSSQSPSSSSNGSNGFSSPNGGQEPKTPEERDRLLMPPPAFLAPRRPTKEAAVSDENSESPGCTTTGAKNSPPPPTKTSLTAA